MTDYNAQLAADIVVRNFGTMWSFTGQSDAARSFLADEIASEDWQWAGPSLVVDHRPASALLEHIEADTDLSTYLV